MIDPKVLIREKTVEQLAQTADSYYKSIGNPQVLVHKPFTSLCEASELLFNFGALLSGLRLGTTMKVLDFGAGCCWITRALSIAKCQVIACDVSKTALEIGEKALLESADSSLFLFQPQFLWFDGHRMDLPDECVDRIVCSDAFHHIPNQEEVLAEMARVLRPGGIAGFSEVGRNHSKSAQAQSEMANYDVLENDIYPEQLGRAAMQHGFTSITVHAMLNRPLRLSEYCAIVSNTEEAQTVYDELDESLRRRIENAVVFFLHKGPFIPDSRLAEGLAHRIEPHTQQMRANAGESVGLSVSITNTGSARWLSHNVNSVGVVCAGAQLYDQQGKMLALNFARAPIPCDMMPGETVELSIPLVFDGPGQFHVKVDLVAEGVAWFQNYGSTLPTVAVSVEE